jgi:tetratricopeptide (TPR) repeat protein
LATLKQALAQAQAAGNALDTGFVERLLATALLQAGDAAGAQAHLAAARQHLVPLLKPQDATLAMLDLQSGRLALQRGDATEAQARFMAAQALLDRASARHLGRFRVAVDRTRAALALGDLVAAQASADQALVQAQQFSAGFDSSDFLGEARLVLAEVAAAKGQFRQAFELGRQAVGHYKGSLGADAPVVAKAQAQVDRWATQR